MTQAKRTVTVDSRRVFCEGNPNLKMGHPRVFLQMNDRDYVLCPYCATRFVLREKKRPSP